MKKILLFLLLGFVIVGCNEKEKSELDKILEQKNYIIVDVRTLEEYTEGHLKNAINLPYDQIDNSILLEKDKKILVYCKSGRRSSIAKETLERLGYSVYDLGAYENIELPKE